MRSGRVRCREKASSIAVVPTTLTVAWREASVSDWAVPVSAARCTTAEGRTWPSTSSQVAASVTSPTTSSTRSSSAAGRVPAGWTCGCNESRATTRSKRASSRSARPQPRKPAPPVINAVVGTSREPTERPSAHVHAREGHLVRLDEHDARGEPSAMQARDDLVVEPVQLLDVVSGPVTHGPHEHPLDAGLPEGGDLFQNGLARPEGQPLPQLLHRTVHDGREPVGKHVVGTEGVDVEPHRAKGC